MVSWVLVGLSSRRNWVGSQVWYGSIFQSLKRGRHLCSYILSVKPRGQLTKVPIVTITTFCKISLSFFQVVKLAFALNTRHLRKGKADTRAGYSENCLLPALIPCPFPIKGLAESFHSTLIPGQEMETQETDGWYEKGGQRHSHRHPSSVFFPVDLGLPLFQLWNDSFSGHPGNAETARVWLASRVDGLWFFGSFVTRNLRYRLSPKRVRMWASLRKTQPY